MAKFFIIAGLLIFTLGIIMYFAPWLLNWFGKLPGDIRIKTENSVIFVPLTSMIILSVVITLLLNLFKH